MNVCASISESEADKLISRSTGGSLSLSVCVSSFVSTVTASVLFPSHRHLVGASVIQSA